MDGGETSPTDGPKIVTPAGESVNLRDENGAVFFVVPDGTPVRILAAVESDGYQLVQVAGQTGYVLAEFIQ
jgi:hypothetical protein